jgi:hypothetical protein
MLIAAGVLSFAGMLVASLRMSERAKAVNIVLEMSPPALGTYVSLDGKYARLYITHDESGSIRAFSVPLKEGKVAMPDREWYRAPIYLCADFGITPSTPVTVESIWACHDAESPEFWRPRWRWGIDGTPALDGSVAPMWPIQVDASGGKLKVHKWDVRS